MIARPRLLALLFIAGTSGCGRLHDVLPCMDTPAYRDPPGGFSSTYHRAVTGAVARPVSPPPQSVPPGGTAIESRPSLETGLPNRRNQRTTPQPVAKFPNDIFHSHAIQSGRQ